MNLSHDALLQNCKNGSTPLNKRAARAPDKKKNFLMTSPEQLVQIYNNSTELFFLIPSIKIAQMVLPRWKKGHQSSR